MPIEFGQISSSLFIKPYPAVAWRGNPKLRFHQNRLRQQGENSGHCAASSKPVPELNSAWLWKKQGEHWHSNRNHDKYPGIPDCLIKVLIRWLIV